MDVDISDAQWRKATASGGNGGSCVEVASNLPGVVAVRDSKNPDGGFLAVPPAAFGRLVDEIKAGGFRLP